MEGTDGKRKGRCNVKVLGNVVFVIGLTGFLLGMSGYDSSPLIAGIMAFFGMVLTYIGYQIRDSFYDYEDVFEEVIDTKK